MVSLIIAAVVLIFAISVLAPAFHHKTINTKDVFNLSNVELAQLKDQALHHGDAHAAYRVSQYYSMSNYNPAHWLFWVHRSSDLGNKDAQRCGSNTKMRYQSPVNHQVHDDPRHN